MNYVTDLSEFRTCDIEGGEAMLWYWKHNQQIHPVITYYEKSGWHDDLYVKLHRLKHYEVANNILLK